VQALDHIDVSVPHDLQRAGFVLAVLEVAFLQRVKRMSERFGNGAAQRARRPESEEPQPGMID
jgi:hypothetical protein